MRNQFNLFTIIAAIVMSARGQGTIDRNPARFAHSYQFQGYHFENGSGMSPRMFGLFGKRLNQRQYRKRYYKH